MRHEHAEQEEQAIQRDGTVGQAQDDYLPVTDRVRALLDNAGASPASVCQGFQLHRHREAYPGSTRRHRASQTE
jgi:hypothetical protein